MQIGSNASISVISSLAHFMISGIAILLDLATLLCHYSQIVYQHWVFISLNWFGESIYYFMRKNLVKFFYLWAEVEVFGNLLDTLPAHRRLNNIFSSHIDSG